MKKSSILTEWCKDKEFAILLAQENAMLELSEAVIGWIQENSIDLEDLAKKMGRNPQEVYRMIYKNKVTLPKLAEILWALGVSLEVTIKPNVR